VLPSLDENHPVLEQTPTLVKIQPILEQMPTLVGIQPFFELMPTFVPPWCRGLHTYIVVSSPFGCVLVVRSNPARVDLGGSFVINKYLIS
jgi:hypothetical protein